MIARYAKERTDSEPFGDWVIRAGIIAPTTSGAEFCEYRSRSYYIEANLLLTDLSLIL